MIGEGKQNLLTISNYPVTRAEKDQYVPTALVPNIALSTTDDATDETTAVNYMQWAYKPILLVSTKHASEYVSDIVEVSFAIEVTFRGLR